MNQSLPPSCTPEDLIKKGFYLFPCNGKTPCIKGWPKESSIDPNKIQAWKKKFPGCSWGVDCGKSGLFVLDDDSGKNQVATASLLMLELEYGCLPFTFTVQTLSGGFHYYFHGHGRNSAGNKLGPGLDTRGDGGFVVAPCSPGYEITKDIPIIPAPSWLIDLAGKPIERKEPPAPTNVNLDTEFAVRKAADFLQNIAEPSRQGEGGDNHAYRVACQVRDFGISQNTCLDLMLEHFDPRCQPPWGEELAGKVANAYTYAGNPLGAQAPETVFQAVSDEMLAMTAPSRFKWLTRDDIMALPPLDWRVKGLIPTRGLFQVYGPSTTGKSFLMFDMLVAIAEGREWFGRKVKQAPVRYVCLEGEAGVRQRIDAWEKHNGRRLPDNFQILMQTWSIITKQDVIDLATSCPKESVVIIDTQNRAAPTVDESASKDMGAIIEGAKTLERIIRGAVGLIAHTGKDISKGSRGHSSQLPTMDAVIELSRDGDIRTWTARKVKDGQDGFSADFALKVIELGVDEDGDKVSSCVVDMEVVKATDTDGFDLTEREAVAWLVIKNLASENNSGAVVASKWKEGVGNQIGLKKGKELDNAFNPGRAGLLKKGLVKKQNGIYVISALTAVETED